MLGIGQGGIDAGAGVDPGDEFGDLIVVLAGFLNDGDLSMPYAGKRLASVGLDLVTSSHRRGTVRLYDFIDGTGALVYRAHDRAAASAFVSALRE